MDIEALQQQLRTFVSERDWEQFQSPKNLAMALTAEAGELLELFQWLSEEQSRTLDPHGKDLEMARQEIADVQIYLLRLADQLGIDLDRAVQDKLRINAEKYPVDLARGNATKYNRR